MLVVGVSLYWYIQILVRVYICVQSEWLAPEQIRFSIKEEGSCSH